MFIKEVTDFFRENSHIFKNSGDFDRALQLVGQGVSLLAEKNRRLKWVALSSWNLVAYLVNCLAHLLRE